MALAGLRSDEWLCGPTHHKHEAQCSRARVRGWKSSLAVICGGAWDDKTMERLRYLGRYTALFYSCCALN